MRDLPDTEKNYFLEKCSIKENLSTTSGQNVFCLKPSTTENIFMLEEQNAKYIFGLNTVYSIELISDGNDGFQLIATLFLVFLSLITQ